MITVYDSNEGEFDTLGNGVVTPSSCTLSYTLGGEWTLAMEMPIDAEGKWKLVKNESILKVPVAPYKIPNKVLENIGTRLIMKVWDASLDDSTHTTDLAIPIYSEPDEDSLVIERMSSSVSSSDKRYCYLASADMTFDSSTEWTAIITRNSYTAGYIKSKYIEKADPNALRVWIHEGDGAIWEEIKVGSAEISIGPVGYPYGNTFYGYKYDSASGNVTDTTFVVNGYRVTTQLFRVFKVTKSYESIQIEAKHIFYDLASGLTKDKSSDIKDADTFMAMFGYGSSEYSAYNAAKDICSTIYRGVWSGDSLPYIQQLQITSNYPIKSSDSSSSSTASYTNYSALTKTMTDNFGLTLILNNGLGYAVRSYYNDRSKELILRHGKDISSVTWTQDVSNIATHVVFGYTNSSGSTLYTNGNDPVISPKYKAHPEQYSHPYYHYLDLTNDVKIKSKLANGKAITDDIAKSIGRSNAGAMFFAGLDEPDVTLEVEFVDLRNTIEYQDYKFLETVEVGDVIRVISTPLEIDEKMKVVGYEWDCILKRYNSITLGKAKDTLDSVISRSY